MTAAARLAAIRARIEADPATYGVVDSWQAAEAAHAKLHAKGKSRQRRVPMAELRQKLQDAGLYAALRNCRENVGSWTVAQRQAVTALADALDTLADLDPAAFVARLDELQAAGLLSQARRDALAAMATEAVSDADLDGLPGPNDASAADIWEAFGWPGKGTADKGPLNTYRDKTGNVLAVAP